MAVKGLHKHFLGRDMHGKDEGGWSKQNYDDFEEKKARQLQRRWHKRGGKMGEMHYNQLQ
jgi:hypothetical protein